MTVPWEHQEEAINLALQFSSYMFAHDMGCIDGNAIINMNRASVGRKIKLRDLYNLFHATNSKFPINAKALCNDILKQHRIKNVIHKGFRKTIKITTKLGKSLILTSDHEIAMPNKTWGCPKIGNTILTNGAILYVECGKKEAIYKDQTLCSSCIRKGLRNGRYVRGKLIDKDGYVRTSGKHSHPRSNPAGQVYEHILIMEKHLGRFVATDEIIHHIDKNKSNNTIKNLQLMTHKDHCIIHEFYKNMDGGISGTGGKIKFIPKEDVIISIKDAGIKEVYDIIMDDPHRNFVANGIIVHNCGKSFEAIEVANRIEARKILIKCPKSVMDVWPEQFQKHSRKKWRLLVLNKGSVKKKAEILTKALELQKITNNRLAVIVNYDAAWRSGLGPDYNKKNRIINKGVILSTIWDLVIADESHRLKSPSSKASWFAYQIAKNKKARRRLCLTGTPMPHSPLDLYAQFRFMDFDIFGKNFTQFRNRYAIIRDMGDFKKVVGFQREEELNALLYSRTHRVVKGDVLDLPPVMHEIRYCELSPAARKIYNSLKIEFVAWLEDMGDKVTVNNALVKLLRLGQITGGFLQLDSGESQFICRAKLDILADIFEDLPLEEPIVIFARFTNEIQRIKELANKMKRSAAELSGQMNQLKDWKRGEFNIIVIQIRAGGVGVDLTRAHYCAYYSTGYSLGDYEQSLARIDRPGQTVPVTYYNLLADRTVDIDVHRSLSKKKAVVEYILKKTRDKN